MIIDNITIEHLGIKEIDALLRERWQAQSTPPAELQISSDTIVWYARQTRWMLPADYDPKVAYMTGYLNKYALPPNQSIHLTIDDQLPFRSIRVIEALPATLSENVRKPSMKFLCLRLFWLNFKTWWLLHAYSKWLALKWDISLRLFGKVPRL